MITAKLYIPEAQAEVDGKSFAQLVNCKIVNEFNSAQKKNKPLSYVFSKSKYCLFYC